MRTPAKDATSSRNARSGGGPVLSQQTLVLQDPSKLTLTVGLAYLQSTFSVDPRTIAAGAMIALLPILLLFVAVQRFFFKGVGEGAVKG
jgi:ABC-type glycerol-3-phosphate transport system permease component